VDAAQPEIGKIDQSDIRLPDQRGMGGRLRAGDEEGA